MFLLAFLITASAAVIAQDLLGVPQLYDSNILNSFSEKTCENSTRWELVNYDNLEITPPYDGSSMAIRASKKSCISSFAMDFVNGTLETFVYLRTISKYSGITITIFDEEGSEIIEVTYRRNKENFIIGWTVISIPITKHGNGYIQLSGQSLSSELVLIDSLRYTPDVTTTIPNNKKAQISKLKSSIAQANSLEHNIEDGLFVFEFNEVDGSGEGEEDIEGSGESGETEYPESEEVIENPVEPEFWNAFTITLVSVGAFVVVGSISVGTYYLGKNAGASASPPLDLEALETPAEIIPRVRSVYIDDRFSRFS